MSSFHTVLSDAELVKHEPLLCRLHSNLMWTPHVGAIGPSRGQRLKPVGGIRAEISSSSFLSTLSWFSRFFPVLLMFLGRLLLAFLLLSIFSHSFIVCHCMFLYFLDVSNPLILFIAACIGVSPCMNTTPSAFFWSHFAAIFLPSGHISAVNL